MLKIPKRVAFRKLSKMGRLKGLVNPRLQLGDVGRLSAEYGRVSARQLEACRRSIRFHMARQGKLWMIVFPHRPVTAKPAEVRMGGGTGSVKYWGTRVKPGSMRFELRGVSPTVAQTALRAGAKKLPVAVSIHFRPERLPQRGGSTE